MSWVFKVCILRFYYNLHLGFSIKTFFNFTTIGALLSHILLPVYLDSITIGKYSSGNSICNNHLKRVLYNRIYPISDKLTSGVFHVNEVYDDGASTIVICGC